MYSTEFDTVTKKILKNNCRKAQGPIVAGIKVAMLQIMHPILGKKCCWGNYLINKKLL